ncbi:MAG: transporter [Phycisphaerales bacterium JB039]
MRPQNLIVLLALGAAPIAASAASGDEAESAPRFGRIGLAGQPEPSGADAQPPGQQPDAPAQAPASGGAQYDSGDLARKLQNPVSDLISVPLQWNLDLNQGPDDAGYRATLNIQPVIPISLDQEWNLITRTIVPVIYQERVSGDGSDFGLGDTVASQFFSPKAPGPGGIIWGVGPVELLPTGTDKQIRSETLGLGPTGVLLRQEGPWTYGALANHIWAVAGGEGDGRPAVNQTFIQPFVSYTFPDTTSFTLNSESTYDWANEQWTIPVNAMANRIFSFRGQPISAQVGGRYYFDGPSGAPEWGVRFTITLLFPK